MRTYYVEGKDITDVATMCEAFGRAVGAPRDYFGADIQGFDDCLFGGLKLLDTPCEIVWRDSDISRGNLDCDMLAADCLAMLDDHEIDSPSFQDGKQWAHDTLTKAKAGIYSMFDNVIEMIESVPERSSGRRQIKLTLQ